jgi:hypothetical protein
MRLLPVTELARDLADLAVGPGGKVAAPGGAGAFGSLGGRKN